MEITVFAAGIPIPNNDKQRIVAPAWDMIWEAYLAGPVKKCLDAMELNDGKISIQNSTGDSELHLKNWWEEVRKKFFVGRYKPKQVVHWFNTVRSFAAKEAKLHDLPHKLPCEVTYRYVFPRPKSVKRLLMSVKPDLDNLDKVISDACQGVLWKNDSQIVKKTASKQYDDNLHPGVWIKVEYLE